MVEDEIWADDLLERSDFAEFLTDTLVARTASISEKQGQRGWTVALDATWGAGKSFFVERWTKHLRNKGHPVVLFDAWENDIGDEAAVALMAEIGEEMNAWVAKLSKKDAVQRTARTLIENSAKKLRKSVMPVAKVIASGLLKKAIGTGIQEMIDAGAEPSEKQIVDAVKASADDALDKAFEVSMEEHRQRKSNIREFKEYLVKLIDLIESNAGAKLPLFVFIDELDRCRPTYAISMLEEVKHIFGMDKVCFIVSTNLSQLRHSVSAVYGHSFDAELYLKRFFDQSIELPEAKYEKHINVLLGFFDSIKSKSNFTAIPDGNIDRFKRKDQAIGMLTTAFGLDPRSQKQVFRMADSVAASVGSQVIHTTFLFFLCALLQKSKPLFDDLERGSNPKDICIGVLKSDPKFSYRVDHVDGLKKIEGSLSSVIGFYVEFSRLTLSEIAKRNSRGDYYRLANVIADNLLQESRVDGIESSRPIISDYYKLVRYAGYLKE